MDDSRNHWLYLALLILSGEAIFILPFVITRIFRPTVMAAFEVNNVELGICFSIYGIVAMVSYLLGGPIADKYPPKKLIAVALCLTALAGFVYAQFPDLWVLQLLYGWWGFTTIFLFWAPMIKATRVWGGANSQGKAFSFLDGGRGLTGALFGLLGVLIFTLVLPETAGNESEEAKRVAFGRVIYVSSGLILLIGFLVWKFMELPDQKETQEVERISWHQVKEVLQLRSVWLLMLIICCGYVGYKITDVISLYAEEVMQMDMVQSAQVGTFLQFLRPATGIALGLIVDRFKITLILVLGFIVCMVGGLLFGLGIITPTTSILFFISVFIVGVGVYACRALYFSILRIGRIPLAFTGTAVGLISLIGYTPDIFAGPAYGYLLDTYPGAVGHQLVFWMLFVFSALGTFFSILYHRKYNR
ncbi:nitrate/nitrite transporter [Flavobacterium sp. ASW18X]|uniref:MFS transporter n=1 Tax=Flavobacterium sp. ASW18X TaxID=2572595 RepID=UPI0010AE7DFF|nr:MFS transporter [Flavobacterium sp. ASW18X]